MQSNLNERRIVTSLHLKCSGIRAQQNLHSGNCIEMATNEKNNEIHLTSPEWLNVAFFENILKQVEAESAKVTNLELKPGTLENDNYSSILYRTKVNYRLQSQPKQEKTASFILKVKPFVEDVKKEMLGDLHLFQTEILMYTKVLPKIEKVLRQYGDQTILAPKLIASSVSPTQTYLIFDDLTLQGYTTIGSRHIYLDEGKIAMHKLAKLHAISYKLNKEEQDAVITSLDKGSMNSLDFEKIQFLKHGIRLLKEVLSEHVDLKQFVPHIESVEHLLLPKTLELFNAHSSGKRDGILVLNHGDFHLKNMMIQKVDGKLTDLMLFDYQVSIFGSPVIDLHYAFTMMFSPEMRRDHYDELLNFYISNFQQTLRKTEFKGHIPTDIEIRQELKKHKYWQLFVFLTFLNINHALVEEDAHLAGIIENTAVQKQGLQNPKLLNELRELLPRFLENGYFELE